MKLYLLTIIFTWISLSLCAQDYRLNDTLYIWEMHGLEMIDDPANPDQNREKFYYGLPARVVDTDIRRYPVSMEVNEGFQMPGHWVRVIINQDTGYVFDGYLSGLKPFDLRSNARGINLVRHNLSGSGEVSKGVQSITPQGLNEGESRDINFDNGIDWNIKNVKPCLVEKYTIPRARFVDAYQWMMAVYSNYFDQNATYMAEPEFIRINGTKYEFILKDNGQNRKISVYHKNGRWVINSFLCAE